jgi:hypothetical protein
MTSLLLPDNDWQEMEIKNGDRDAQIKEETLRLLVS